MLSPLDWALIESWQEREVPLHIVLRGIERVFDTIDKQPNRKRSVKSLFYCKEEIEAQFAEWLETQVGKGVPSSESQVPSSSVETNSSKNELFARDAVELHLEKVYALIDESLLEQADASHLKAETEKSLAVYRGKMETDVYRRTFDLMIL